jgi:hypothetical protein
MSYKDLLVFVDHAESSQSRIAAAATLARAFEAHLTGLCLMAASPLPVYYGAQIPESVLETIRQQAAEQAENSRAAFEQALKADGVASECRVVACSEVQVPEVIGVCTAATAT